jgi:hypothetical protein
MHLSVSCPNSAGYHARLSVKLQDKDDGGPIFRDHIAVVLRTHADRSRKIGLSSSV